ncbi:MAG TPA: MFS transporter, partial [Rectinemataceae bacterium]|nr:MFS transporter [Rectinemataceae bacterium]
SHPPRDDSSILQAVRRRLVGLFGMYQGLPAPIYTLFLATVANGIGIFVFPFLALFLTKRLGWDAAATGMFMFLANLAYLPGSFIGGALADRLGRKRVMVLSQAMAGLVFVACGILGDSPAVAWLALANLFFDGITDPARTAMLTDLTRPENRQSSFGLIYLGHNLGFACGPIVAGYLFYAAPRWLFFGNALSILGALMLVMAFVPETRPSKAQIEASFHLGTSEAGHRGGLLSALRSRPVLLVYLGLTALYGFVYAQHRFALPLQTDALFGRGGAALYGGLMTLNAVLVVILATPIVALTRRWKPIANVAASGFLFALGFGMIGLCRSPALLFLSTGIWTLGEIVNATNDEAYVANHTPMSHRGRFQAVVPLIAGSGFALSSPIVGQLVQTRGVGAVWPLLGLVGLIAALALSALGFVEARTGTARRPSPR